MAGTRMAAPLLALREGHTPLAVGMLLALFALTQVFLALPAGRYADRHGLKRPLKFAVVAATLGAGAAAALPIFPVLCLAALLTGGATGVASICLQRHAGRVAAGPVQLRQVFSWLSIGPAFSNFVGPFMAGLLIDNGGFRVAFFALALMPLITWACIRGARELPPVAMAAGDRKGSAWDLLRQPDFRRLMVINWVLSSCWDVHLFIVPVLGHERGLAASVIGTLLGTFALAAALVRLAMPLIAARLQEWQVIAGAMATTALVFGVYPLVAPPWAMGVCSALLGVALGSVQPMVMSTLHQITPAHRHGEALGLRLMSLNGSSVVMPMLFGAAGAAVGVAGVFWSTGAVMAACTRLAFAMKPRPA
ncbi:MFS transporter [Ramlibacter sp. AW1]|uniref:MFS transporter n=2 Tax=Ramlibacter aurantiacus TaxID=2801330 RepID=A0A937D1A9_9BURK|nr:MFS transporter [Ramlibacter aurantiacus]